LNWSPGRKDGNHPTRGRLPIPEFIPLLVAKDREKADKVLVEKLFKAYSTHRVAIDEGVKLCSARAEAVEKEAAL